MVVCTFGGFLCLGWAVWVLQMWGCCRPGLRKCQKWPIAGQKLQTGGWKCQTGPLFFKNKPKKTLFGKPRPPWQVLLRNVQIAGNLAQNLSGTPVTQPQRDQYRGRVTGNTHGKMLKAPQHWHGGVACHGGWPPLAISQPFGAWGALSNVFFDSLPTCGPPRPP